MMIIVISKIYEVLGYSLIDDCKMVHIQLRRQGIIINHKCTERLYRGEYLLTKARKRRKNVSSETRIPAEVPKEPGKHWAMDFIHDSVESGRKLKILTVIDPACNRSPLIHTDFSIPGKKLVDILEEYCEENYYPKILKCDNGPEFRSKELDKWCYKKGIQIQFSRPGKPTDNCHIESFNGTFRSGCLNMNYFRSLNNAREVIEKWWNRYNFDRPQKRLKRMTPVEYESMIKQKSNLKS